MTRLYVAGLCGVGAGYLSGNLLLIVVGLVFTVAGGLGLVFKVDWP